MGNEILNIIEMELGHGVKSKIAQKSGVSYLTVLRCFKGLSKNQKVISAAVSYYEEHKAEVNSLRNRIINAK